MFLPVAKCSLLPQPAHYSRPEKQLLRSSQLFCGRELLPLSVIEAVRVGDPLAVESVLRYYDGYMNKLCTRTLCDLDGLPHVRVDEHMKDRLQAKLTEVIVNKK